MGVFNKNQAIAIKEMYGSDLYDKELPEIRTTISNLLRKFEASFFVARSLSSPPRYTGHVSSKHEEFVPSFIIVDGDRGNLFYKVLKKLYQYIGDGNIREGNEERRET